MFDAIPDEVLVVIFQYLRAGEWEDADDDEDKKEMMPAGTISNWQREILRGRVSDARLVCKRFHAMVWDPNFHTSLELHADGVGEEKLLAALERRPKLKDLSVGFQKIHFVLRTAFECCPDLRRLVVANAGPIMDQTFFDICGKEGKSLQELVIKDVSGKDQSLVKMAARHPLSIGSLRIESQLWAPTFYALGAHCPHLEEVFCDAYSPHMYFLWEGIRATLRTCVFGPNFPNRDITDIFGDGGARFPLLEKLEICFDGISDDGLEKIADGCPNLKDVSLRWGFWVSCGGMKRLLTSLTKLETLRVEKLGAVGQFLTAEKFKSAMGVTSVVEVKIENFINANLTYLRYSDVD